LQSSANGEAGRRPELPREQLWGLALSAILLGVLFVLSRPWGPFNAMGIAATIAACFAVARRRGGLGLALLTLAFLALLPVAGSVGLDRFRILEVAAILWFFAMVAASQVVALRLLPPAQAHRWSALAALIGIAPEVSVGLAIGSADLPVRPEWRELLADSGSAASSAVTGAYPAPGTGSLGNLASGSLGFPASAGSNEASGIVRWEGGAQPDSLIGIVFRPNSELRRIYPDDRQDYFEAMDLRSRIWNLVVLPGSAARLVLPPDDPDVIRIEIQRANPDTFWTIQLEKAQLDVTTGVPYRLEFQARADRPRPVSLAVGQAHPPWNGLGLFEEIQLTPEWQRFGLNFSVPAADSNARIWYGLARSAAAVELSRVVLLGRMGQPVERPLASGRYHVAYRFNQLGCRGSDPAPATPGAARVLVLGDAFTLGVGVHEQDTFSARLRSGPGPGMIGEALNCGVPGYSTREQRILFQRLRSRYDPDIVLLVLGLDANRAAREVGWAPATSGGRGLGRLFTGWRTILSVWRRTDHDYTASVGDILALHRVVREGGGRLAVAILRTGSEEGWNRLAEAIARGIPGDSIPVFDSEEALTPDHLEGNLIAHPADPYPSEVVHRAAAELLQRFLTPLAAPERRR
jgi:hypothetical protein